MDLSTAQQQQLLRHHYQKQQQQQQEMMTGSHSDSQSLDSIIASSKPHKTEAAQPQDKKPRPPDNEAQKCPRCDSTNTKFCYYNNYSLTQPRYFCKSCRRYWTKGGTLRNVPVGGGCRKSSSIKRPSSPSPCFSSSMFKRAHNHEAGLMGVDPLLHHQLQLSSYYGFEDCNNNNANNNNPHGVSINIAYNNINGGLFQNLCYGGGNSSSVSGISQEMNNNIMEAATSTTTTTTTTTTKQEGVLSGNERAMWGFPWQLSYGDIGTDGHVVDPPISIRGPWNGLMPNSGWHALLNTTTPPPLM